MFVYHRLLNKLTLHCMDGHFYSYYEEVWRNWHMCILGGYWTDVVSGFAAGKQNFVIFAASQKNSALYMDWDAFYEHASRMKTILIKGLTFPTLLARLKEHLQKKTVLRGQTPPPPVWEFIRRNTTFFWRCPKVNKIKKIVNYILAPQDDFGMQKKTW